MLDTNIRFLVVRLFRFSLLLIWLTVTTVPVHANAINQPHSASLKLQLAGATTPSRPISEYLVSEKFDGVRGFWDGHRMYSRSGREIILPPWFVEGFPNDPLDGELWIGRGQFEAVSALTRQTHAKAERWRDVRFMVFDFPAIDLPFEQRYRFASRAYSEVSEFLVVIPQRSYPNQQALDKVLDELLAQGAEGLMLHHKQARYRQGRNNDLVKLKRYQDAEAKVIGLIPGKGKYQGMMGALRVITADGIVFKLGTGFTEAQRRQPPAVGTVVTYKYYGLTKNGVPRFASFMRVRDMP